MTELIGGREVGVHTQDSPDVWSLVECGQLEVGDITDLDLFMPNGLLVNVRCNTDSTLAILKQELFNQARKMPLYEQLLSPSDYIFFTIGSNGEREELFDETKSIFSLRLFVPLLSLVEPEGNREEKQLARNIGLAIGHPLSEMELKLTEENMAYRMDLYRVMEQAVSSRGVSDFSHYAFPEELSSESDLDIPPQVKSKIEVADLYIEVWYRGREDEVAGRDDNCVCVRIRKVVRVKPKDVVVIAIKELTVTHKLQISESPSEFLLQPAGRRSFLTKDIKLTSFESVRSAFENYRIPKFLLRRKDIVLAEFPIPEPLLKPSWVRAYESRLGDTCDNPLKRCSLWDVDDNLKMRVHSASHITISDIHRIYVKAAVYHGSTLIMSKESERVSPSNPRWTNGWIDFDVYLKDLAPATQMCLSLVAIKVKKKEEHSGIGWVNIRLFDWNNQLLQGKQTLYLWPFSKHWHELLYPLGQTGWNDNHDTARIEVEFFDQGSVVEYPTLEDIAAYVSKLDARECGLAAPANTFRQGSPDVVQLLEISRHLDGEKLSDSQQKHLWKMREYIANFMPDLLPLLANCAFIWSTRESFCRLYELLARWGPIRSETALELLDFKYPDRQIREFAVGCLDRGLDNDRLLLYIMPLVQALKYEPYGACALTRMLLYRSLCNYRIGHVLFWLLRSELGQMGEVSSELPNMYKRFALLIEAYCRGNFTHLDSMLRQVDMVARLTDLSKLVKSLKDKESATKRLQKDLLAHVDVMQNMSSPLDPLDTLGLLNVEMCKVIGSAKQPLRLTWANAEPLARLYTETHQIIFKNGDDLRQDMLTLQVLRIMDAVWKSHDLDFSLSIYEVLPMGKNVGMIHVVQNCNTLFEIQCAAKQLGSTFNMEISLINKWIHTCDSKAYLECVDRFTASCAGYCIATYVLGIKDRHQDNIMLTKDGRLFHIDFGHFLGHYKKKLGINRDRVPFVLTDHFLYVIAKGKANFRDSHEYKKFKQLCTDAYIMLHERARLFISLFTMMLCMGLPELENMEDVDFLKTTLCAELDKQQAISYFQKVFEDACNGAWSTKTNWFFHSVKHL